MTDTVAGAGSLPGVPRTSEATDAAAVAWALERRLGRPIAWWGMVMLIASEGTLFGTFVGTYFFLRFNAASWPPVGIPAPKLLVPLILVGCLAATSVPMQLASRAARAGRLVVARRSLAVAMVVQVGYLAYELHDYRAQLHTFDVTRDAYSSIYYTMLGADHAHVFAGLLLDAWLLLKLARGLTTYRANAAQAVAWYWHAVNLITLVVIGTLLSARA